MDARLASSRRCGGRSVRTSEGEIALLETFADQAVIAIENARLFEELEQRNAELQESNRQVTGALEQQAATAEVLRVIASSPTDLPAVLHALVESAARLCEAGNITIWRVAGDQLERMASLLGDYPAEPPGSRAPITRGVMSGRAIIEKRTLHVPDIFAELDTEFTDVGSARWADSAYRPRSFLAIPLLRQDAAIGTLVVSRGEIRPFSDAQVALLETFADQAAIAIENARLFEELEQRNQDLSEALAQQTATSRLLQVVSGSQTDTQPVFDAIVASAVSLCDGVIGVVYLFDGEFITLGAHFDVLDEPEWTSPGSSLPDAAGSRHRLRTGDPHARRRPHRARRRGSVGSRSTSACTAIAASW